MSTDPEEVAAREARAAAERRVYETLKQGLWRWSLATTALFFAGSIVLFSGVGLQCRLLLYQAFLQQVSPYEQRLVIGHLPLGVQHMLH